MIHKVHIKKGCGWPHCLTPNHLRKESRSWAWRNRPLPRPLPPQLHSAKVPSSSQFLQMISEIDRANPLKIKIRVGQLGSATTGAVSDACTRAHSFERLKTMERGASIMRLLGVVVVVAAACGAVASGEKPRPNLILLLVDDLGHNDVGWANNRTVRVINSILHRSCSQARRPG
jgi:hypothetical protein